MTARGIPAPVLQGATTGRIYGINGGAMGSEADIYRSANLWFELHGEEAVAKARGMVRAMQERATTMAPKSGCR